MLVLLRRIKMSEEMDAEYWEEVEKFMGKRIPPGGIDDPYKDC